MPRLLSPLQFAVVRAAMLIREVRLRGFKSFSATEETVINFSPHINLVVGRNGAGKSNCFEAIHFVLLAPATNENLRLHLMHNKESTDGYYREAVVEVCLDNHERRLPLNCDEVRIQRRITDKTDQLRINNKLVPKNKLTTIMETAGCSLSNPFFIVKQGQVSELATCSNARRLEVVLELAGVNVFDLRINQTHRVLSECALIFDEMTALLDDMAKDIEEAETLKEKHREMLELEAKKTLITRIINEKEMHSIKGRMLALDEVVIAENRRLEEGTRDLIKLRHRLEHFEEDIGQSKEEEIQLDQERYKVLSKMEELERKVARAEAQLESNERQRNSSPELDSQFLKEKQAILRNDVNKGKEHEIKLVNRIKNLQNELADAEARLQNNADDLTRLHCDKTSFDEQDRSMIEREISNLKRYLDEAKNRNKELEDYFEAKVGEEAQLITNCQELDGEISALQNRIEDLQDSTRSCQRQLKQLEKECQAIDSQMYEIHQKEMETSHKLSEIRTRIVAQSALKSAFVGIESVKVAALSLGFEDISVVGELLLDSSPNLDLAISVFLGRRVFACVVPTARDATHLLAKMKELNLPGEVDFIAIDKIKPRPFIASLSQEEQRVAKPIVEVLKFLPDHVGLVHWLFRDTLLVENEDVFGQFRGRRCITYEGSEVQTGGVMSGGYHGRRRNSMTLFRLHFVTDRAKTDLKNEMERLTVGKEALMKKMEKFTETSSKCHMKIERAEVTLVDFQSKRLHKREERSSISRLVNTLQAELSAKKNEVTHLEVVLKDRESFLNGSNDEELSQRTKMQRIDMLVRDSEILRRELKEKFHKKLELDKKLNICSVRVESLCRDLDEVDGQLKERRELEERVLLLSQSPSQLSELVNSDSNALKLLKEELESITRQLDQVVKERITMKEPELESLSSEERTTTNELAKLYDHCQSSRDQIEDLQLRLSSIKVKLGSNEYSKFTKEDLTPWQKYSSKYLCNELEKIDKRMKNMPLLGKLVVSVMEGKKEELTEFKCQSNDFERDRETLNTLIDDANSSKVEKVNFVLQQCSRYFAEIFRELVPTGIGKVVVELDSNGNPTGIALRVAFDDSQTQLRELQMLSGGQRAIVAIAFMFALQKCDPCPFYVLDEIDAALDQQRRERLAALIAKQTETQFICTTFRPELLQVGDNFVAMKYKKKVSNVLSVDKQQAEDFVVDADIQL